MWHKEPSSALANKVLRAWDNPSPPPGPSLELPPTSALNSEIEEHGVVETVVEADIVPENVDARPVDEPGMTYCIPTIADTDLYPRRPHLV
jgi:hypothetical protein